MSLRHPLRLASLQVAHEKRGSYVVDKTCSEQFWHKNIFQALSAKET